MPKNKLSLDGQIIHMKTKGIKFNIVSEDQAKTFLSEHNYYFRIKAYAKNYDKYRNTNKIGQYINLEFAYLQELSTLDMHLRRLLFNIVIDIEHFAKVRLLKDFSANSIEDGYTIVNKFLTSNPLIAKNLNKHTKYSYSYDLIQKYNNNFALWNILEVITFNDFIRLYKLYYDNYPSNSNLFNLLWSAKTLRNAIAHNNCLINKLNNANTLSIQKNNQINTYIAKNISHISTMSRNNKMKIPFINDFVVTIHLFNKIVTSQSIRFYSMDKLIDLIGERFYLHKDYFSSNQSIISTFDFMKNIVDYYYENSI